jgi:DNA-binding NtrC family response regulator
MNKVLLVDDERDILAAFEGVFRNMKHIQFFTARSARQGIEIAKQEKPQVVLLDLMMPGINGEDALRELKPLLPETKFVIMTGWEDGRTKGRILEIGVEAYFEKPIDLEKVITKVISLVMVKSA